MKLKVHVPHSRPLSRSRLPIFRSFFFLLRRLSTLSRQIQCTRTSRNGNQLIFRMSRHLDIFQANIIRHIDGFHCGGEQATFDDFSIRFDVVFGSFSGGGCDSGPFVIIRKPREREKLNYGQCNGSEINNVIHMYLPMAWRFLEFRVETQVGGARILWDFGVQRQSKTCKTQIEICANDECLPKWFIHRHTLYL